MKIVVHYGDKHLDLGLDSGDDRVVGVWSGPTVESSGVGPDFAARFAEAVAAPRQFPPLSMAVVPGDNVAVAMDLSLDNAGVAVVELARVFAEAGVEGFTVVSTSEPPSLLPPGVIWERHDPDDSSRIAYLATTQGGQRVYLNRSITDADFVVPVGTLGFDRAVGYRGPWSTIYPALSDRATLTRYRSLAANDTSTTTTDEGEAPAGLTESSEVSWLIGCQLQVGVLPDGSDSSGEVIAGLESLVREQGIAAVDRLWKFAVPERADLVIAGVGASGLFASVDELGEALASASNLVRRGGKIVALARVDGPIGKAVRRLLGAENPKVALNRLRGHEGELDYIAARQIAATLAWADVYLSSDLDADTVEDLAIIPLGRPEEAKKLANTAASLIVVNQAERTRCLALDD